MSPSDLPKFLWHWILISFRMRHSKFECLNIILQKYRTTTTLRGPEDSTLPLNVECPFINLDVKMEKGKVSNTNIMSGVDLSRSRRLVVAEAGKIQTPDYLKK